MRESVFPDLQPGLDDQSDLLDILGYWWKLIVFATVLCALVAVAVTPLLPKKYDAHCTIFARSKSGMLSSLSLQLPGSPLNLMASGSSSSDYLAAVLNSDIHAGRVARQLGLKYRPDFAGKRREILSDYRIAEKLKKCVIIMDDRRSSLRITAITRSPILSARIANEYALQLRGSVNTAGRKKRDFISRQLEETEKALDAAAKELKEFQDKSRAVDLDEQTKAAITSLADLQGELTAAQVELREVESDLRTGGDPAALAKLKSRRLALESRIEYLQGTIGNYEAQLAKLPTVAMHLARLKRNVEVQQKIYEIMTEQYQLANLSEESEDEMFEIVDPAVPAEKPCAPKTSVNLATGVLAGLVLGSVLAVRAERRRAYRAKKLRMPPDETV